MCVHVGVGGACACVYVSGRARARTCPHQCVRAPHARFHAGFHRRFSFPRNTAPESSTPTRTVPALSRRHTGSPSPSPPCHVVTLAHHHRPPPPLPNGAPPSLPPSLPRTHLPFLFALYTADCRSTDEKKQRKINVEALILGRNKGAPNQSTLKEKQWRE